MDVLYKFVRLGNAHLKILIEAAPLFCAALRISKKSKNYEATTESLRMIFFILALTKFAF